MRLTYNIHQLRLTPKRIVEIEEIGIADPLNDDLIHVYPLKLPNFSFQALPKRGDSRPKS